MTGVAAFAYPYAPIRSARTVSMVISRTLGGGDACEKSLTEAAERTVTETTERTALQRFPLSTPFTHLGARVTDDCGAFANARLASALTASACFRLPNMVCSLAASA